MPQCPGQDITVTYSKVYTKLKAKDNQHVDASNLPNPVIKSGPLLTVKSVLTNVERRKR